MKKLFIIAVITLFASPVFAATYYMTPTGAGTFAGTVGDEMKWNSGANQTAFVRGNTYLLSSGTYEGRTLSTAVSGTDTITISRTGTGVATITGALTISTSYWDIDGVTGTGNSGHGIVVALSSPGDVITLGTAVSNISLKHIEARQYPTATAYTSMTTFGQILKATAGSSYITIQNCYWHHVFGCMIQTAGSTTDYTIDANYFANNKSTAEMHAAGICDQNSDNFTISNNRWKDVGGSGIWDLIEGPDTSDNGKFYNNIIWHTGTWGSTSAAGIVVVWNDGSNERTATNMKIYSNTIVNFKGTPQNYFAVAGSGNEIKNNLLFCNRGSSTADANYYVPPSVSHTYNHMYDCSGHNVADEPGTGETTFAYDGGTGLWLSQYTTNPFVNWQNEDFRLNSCSAGMDCPVGAGTALDAGYATDITGAVRPANTTWDLGAYEYGAAEPEPDETPPVRLALAPSGEQACTSDPRNVTISLTTDEAATCKYGADVAYASMAGTFDGTGTTSHSKTIEQACDAAYQFFVRCQDDEAEPNINPASVEINYTIAPIAADTTKPTWTSSTLGADGRTLTLVFSEAVKRGTGYADTQVTVTPTGGSATLSYVSGDGSTTLVYYTSRVIYSTATETLTTSIAQPGSGIQDQAENDLDAVSDKITTNSSAQVPDVPPVVGQIKLWPDDVEVGTDVGAGDYQGEFGVKFGSTVAGVITAIRFYKSAANTGTHTGSIWTSDGVLKGTVTFTDETASGWQQQSFATPIHIAANTTYVASYFNPAGYWTRTVGYFGASNFTNPPLYALANTEGNGFNGCTAASSFSIFPNEGSWEGRNFWVDVVFEQRSTVTIGGGTHSVGTIGGAGSHTITW